MLIITVTTLALAGCGAPDRDPNSEVSGDEEAVETVDAFSGRDGMLATMAPIPAQCVGKHDQIDGTKAVFHGCYDWHSSVHAHWAALRMGNVDGSRWSADAQTIAARFTPTSIAAVKSDLRANPSFERPYGRAWFLRLVTEHDKWTAAGSAGTLRALGGETSAGLLTYYQATPPVPRPTNDSEGYRNDAWAMAQLYSYFGNTGDAASKAAAAELIEANFASSRQFFADSNDSDPNAFFSYFWSWAYAVAGTLDAERALDLIRPDELPDEALTPIANPALDPAAAYPAVHHLGMNWSRAWAIKAVARRAVELYGPTHPMSQRLTAAYLRHVRAASDAHASFAAHPRAYYAYLHWVPQFAIYALTD
jgi:hypothetical protein